MSSTSLKRSTWKRSQRAKPPLPPGYQQRCHCGGTIVVAMDETATVGDLAARYVAVKISSEVLFHTDPPCERFGEVEAMLRKEGPALVSADEYLKAERRQAEGLLASEATEG